MAYKILIIEDDALSARLLDLALKRAGYETFIAGNGLTGITRARAVPAPDLVLLDLMLPVMDGFEVLSQIRSDPRTAALPVIVVTGKAQAADRHLALQMGANDYVTKPYSPRDIVTSVEAMLTQQTRASAEAMPGGVVLVVSPQRDDLYSLTASLGVALAQSGHDTALFDPDPYSVDQLLTLSLDPPVGPSKLPKDGGRAEILALARKHPSGLRVLSNLEGAGEFGKLTAEDLQQCVNALTTDGRTTLVTVPLSPPGKLRRLAQCSKRILVVIRDQATAWAATRATLGLLDRLQIPESLIAFVLIDAAQDTEFSEIAPAVVGWLPDVYSASSIRVQKLADTLVQELSTPPP
jgi:DNA-binding response OmpR family regulator